MDELFPLESLPTIEDLITLPERIACYEIKNYTDIYPFLDDYKHPYKFVVLNPYPKLLTHSESFPDFDTLSFIIKKGEKYFSKFYKFWEENIKPLENGIIKKWEKENLKYKPLEKLQEILRLSFPFDSLYIGCILLHFSGSGIFSPPAIFSTIFDKEAKKPYLSWVIGHEATHLILNKYVGVNWERHPLAEKAINLVKSKGGRTEDIEESLCIFMQAKLPEECGVMKEKIKVSNFIKNPIKKKIIECMESLWGEYKNNPSKFSDIVDFMLISTLNAFQKK